MNERVAAGRPGFTGAPHVNQASERVAEGRG